MHILTTILRRLIFGMALLLATTSSNFASAKEFTNHIGMIFVDIPAGNFYMGSCAEAEEYKKRAYLGAPLQGVACPPDSNAMARELPQHKVQIAAFQLGKLEVTLKQFKKFIVATGKTDLLTTDFIEYNPNGDSAPVSIVSWTDAQNFIDWLNQTKLGSDLGVYRLPSEAEWEYAARAGSTTTYSFGNDPTQLSKFAWYLVSVKDKPKHGVLNYPLAQSSLKSPNAFGLYNMHGNLFEWTQDCWNPNYQGAPSDEKPWEAGDCSNRVFRGGSWQNDADYVRSATRFSDKADERSIRIGFRVARTLP